VNLTSIIETNIGSVGQNSENATEHSTETFASVAARKVNNGGGRVMYNPTTNEEIDHRRSVVISGVPEKGTDFQDVAAICRSLDPSAIVKEVFRMGTLNNRGQNDNRKPRLLKVRFPSSSVAKSILQEAKGLKNIANMENYYIRRSMSIEERKNLSALRKKANELNDALDTEPNNRKKYVVVNEKLVVFEGCFRDESGRLTGGKRGDVQYEIVTNGNDINVQLN
jgi:hypothetical protein